MYRDPPLPFPRTVILFPEAARGLWLKALQRPEVELRCRAAETIARAHRRRMKGLETTIDPLIAALDQKDQHPTVRAAVVQALITLEARQASPSLLEQVKSGSIALHELVEPALARWDYRPARAVWLKRLDDPAAGHRSLILAIRALGAVREERAADRLRGLVLAGVKGASGKGAPAPAPDVLHPSVRLEAARALGLLRDSGLEGDAKVLAADPSAHGLVGRLAAVALLSRHRSEGAVRLLQRLARDPEPAVAARAAGRLLEIDPRLLVPALEGLLASPDAAVRLAGVEVLQREPSGEHIRLLGDRLGDAHPDVRDRARRSLQELAAKKELRERVLAEAARVLEGNEWQGLEQAAILVTELDHKPAAPSLLRLLTSRRPEVSLTAAWGLRKLAVPETLPAVLSYVAARLKDLRRGSPAPHPLDFQLSQLNQFLGQQKFRTADETLRGFVPRMGKVEAPEARASAIWALGLFHDGKAVPSLATALEQRLKDATSIPPEDIPVRRMSAITLGRMNAKAALPSLRKFYRGPGLSDDPVSNACCWASARITGEAMPAPTTRRLMERDWFLAPRE
jgi:HEAT repeat protein